MNPLLLDPTRTSLLRKQAINDLTRRYALLQRAVYELLVVEDALGLNEGVVNAGANCGTGAGGFKPGNKCAKGGGHVRTVGIDFDSEVYHGTTRKSAAAFAKGMDLHELERSRTLSEFGDVIYTAEGRAPHQALMFSSGKSEQGARTLVALRLKEGSQVLDLSVHMTRRPMVGADKSVLEIKDRPTFTDDMATWLTERRASRGMKPLDLDTLSSATDPTHPNFDVKEYSSILASYAKDRGFAAMRLADETIIVDRSAIVGARKIDKKELTKLQHTVESTRHLRKKNHLYTDEAGIEYPVVNVVTTFTGNARWSFLTTPQKLEQFKEWLNTQVRANILSGNDLDGDQWIAKYTKTSYKRAANKAYDEVKAPLLRDKLDRYQGGKAQFLERLESETHKQQIKLLASRTYDELADSVGTMSNQISRTLIDGVIQKLPMEKIAANLDKRIGVGLSNAKRIVNTEIPRAFNEAKLYALEDLGVGNVTIMVEWQTASRPCPLCAPLRGIVMTVSQAHGMFPRHPNCMCSPKAITSVNKEGQLRTRSRIAAAIERSLKQERPKRSKRSIATQKKMSTWGGANKRIGKIKRKKKRLTNA